MLVIVHKFKESLAIMSQLSQEMIQLLEKKITAAIERIQNLQAQVIQLEMENKALKEEIQFFKNNIHSLLGDPQPPT